MKWKTNAATLICLLSSFAMSGFADPILCKDYAGKEYELKPKTITIHNNSNATLYPVLSTSKNDVNEWVQACFQSTAPYPTKYVYKLYVNEGTGIAPGSSVTMTLPLFTQLSENRFITWWNGGRVVLADENQNLREPEDKALPGTPAGVSCQGDNTPCNISVYQSNTQFPENIYAQLSEYTFGDSIMPPGKSVRLLKPENVGYNISYVDHVYMPVAIGPKNNPYIGYSGSTQPLDEFRQHLDDFLETDIGNGWPVYNLTNLKLPGGYNIFAQRFGTLPPTDNVPVKPENGFPPVLTVLKCLKGHCRDDQKKSLHFGQAVQRIQNLWGSCVQWRGDITPYVTEKIACPNDMKEKLTAIHDFFYQNHQLYLADFQMGRCNLDPNVKEPVPFTYWEAIKHIYGWVPFNEGCGASANPLKDTKIPGWDHARIQAMFIHDLQYNYQNNVPNELLFNPYVKLIHSSNYLDMDAYGFSVDDAVGFMSELGDGLIFSVGGAEGLENHLKFNYRDGFSVAIGVPQDQVDNINQPLIKRYGACSLKITGASCELKQNVEMPTNSQIAGFRIGNMPDYPVKVAFTDMNDNVYTFIVKTKFAKCPSDIDPTKCPTNRDEIIDKHDPNSCRVMDKNGQLHPKSTEWCQNANPNQNREKQITKNYISFPQPVDYMK